MNATKSRTWDRVVAFALGLACCAFVFGAPLAYIQWEKADRPPLILSALQSEHPVFHAPHRALRAEREQTYELGYRFRGQRYTLFVPVSAEDARYNVDARTMWERVGERPNSKRVGGFMYDYQRLPMIDAMCASLRIQARQLGLDTDGYAELLSSVVQAIPYGSPADGSMRSPVGVIVEHVGDCDERSVLLSALLMHEGFKTAIMEFPGENHATAAISGGGFQYPGTSYVLIETTGPNFLGEWAQLGSELPNGRVLHSRPNVIELGGTTRYSGGGRTAYVIKRYRAAVKTETRLHDAVWAVSGKALPQDEYDRVQPDITAYNHAVTVLNRIADGPTDAQGTYDWLCAHPQW